MVLQIKHVEPPLLGEYSESVWVLLCQADKEFIPPLSSRESAMQKKLNSDVDQPLYQGALEQGDAIGAGPVAYFSELQTQDFLLAFRDSHLVGFMSFRPQVYLPEVPAKSTCYLSTLIVDAKYRRQGISRQLYKRLLAESVRWADSVSTRTWSTNHGHISLINSLGFSQCLQKINDRGSGIDTVYYYKLLV